MYDAIIIGKGPAGITASIYIRRANLNVLVIGKDDGYLVKADKIDNYFGFSEGISGKELIAEGYKQGLRLGVEFVTDQVLSVGKEEAYKVTCINDVFYSKAVILTTGTEKKPPNIDGVAKYEGLGISYCVTCDGFFYRDKKVCILGNGDYAFHEAEEMTNFTKEVTILTNGKDISISDRNKEGISRFNIISLPIKKIEGTEVVKNIIFKDGTQIPADGLFIAGEKASSTDFARNLGVMTDSSGIVTDRNQKTNVDGLYAAGDCTGLFKQIAVAVGQGALAARSLIEYIRGLK
jgi:thioredoxin reductase (NADPH)